MGNPAFSLKWTSEGSEGNTYIKEEERKNGFIIQLSREEMKTVPEQRCVPKQSYNVHLISQIFAV